MCGFESLRIQKAAGQRVLTGFRTEVDYGELKPRGHYSSSEDMKTYFKAFKYLTMTADDPPDPNLPPLDDLVNLTPEVKASARSWISAYDFFIAPSRGPLVWGEKTQPPPYAKHPLEKMSAFSSFMGHGQRGAVFDGLPSRTCPRPNK